MKKLRQGISVAIVLTVIFTMLNGAIAQAESSSNFIVEAGVLTRYIGTSPDVIIPSDLDIAKIGISAFFYKYLSSVTIPNGVTTIEYNAFNSCRNLNKVTLPEGITSIDDSAFGNCISLSEISLPKSLINVGVSVFTNTKLPDPLYIDDSKILCYVPALTKDFIFPESVTQIAGGAFDGCSSLTSLTLPDKLTSINERSFIYCSKLEELVIPQSVTEIGKAAFTGCSNLKKITIPSSVTIVGERAFMDTLIPNEIIVNDGKTLCYVPINKTSFVIPDTVTSIIGYALYSCKKLSTITFPSGLTTIGDKAFSNCLALTSINIPDSVNNIGTEAFNNCSNLSSIKLPTNIISIGTSAFTGVKFSNPILTNQGKTLCYVPTSKTTYSIPNTVTHINGGAFENCGKLRNIVIPSSVVEIGDFAFSGCMLFTSIIIPTSVIEIGDFAFSNCSFKYVFIPKSTTKIGVNAFVGTWRFRLYGEANSYVEQYADNEFYKSMLIKFIPVPAIVGTFWSEYVSNNQFVNSNVTIDVFGYSINKSINKDGKKYYFPTNKKFTLDGKYVITAFDEVKTVKLTFTIDKTSPKIVVKGSTGKVVKKNASVTKSATISVIEKNISTKTLKLNSKSIKWPSTGKVKAKGSYSISIKDKAGNVSIFAFKIN